MLNKKEIALIESIAFPKGTKSKTAHKTIEVIKPKKIEIKTKFRDISPIIKPKPVDLGHELNYAKTILENLVVDVDKKYIELKDD